MKGLLIKDFYCAMQYLKTYLFMMVFFTVFGFAMKNPFYTVFMAIFLGLNIVFSVLSMDELGGFAYCLAMPFSRRQIVREKYLFLILETFVIYAFSMLLGLMLCGFTGESAADCVLGCLFTSAYFLALIAILLPIALKWKLERARMIMLGLVMVSAIVIVAVLRMGAGSGVELPDFFSESPWPILAVSAVFAAVVLLISYTVSLRIFAKKEF